MSKGAKWRIVTREQLQEGYLTYANGVVLHHNYLVLEKRSDGTYLVAEPTEEQFGQ